jgi:hypothetical protein
VAASTNGDAIALWQQSDGTRVNIMSRVRWRMRHTGRMQAILLVGAALNWLGATKLFVETLYAVRAAAHSNTPAEYLQFKLFTAGTAAVFGSLYLYLYIHPVFVVPFLVFGAALKTWAFLLSLYLFLIRRLPRRALFEFGVSNGIVGALFWIYLLHAE